MNHHLVDLTNPNAVVTLLEELIRLPSVTPDDAGCQELIAAYLSSMGFTIERLRFGEVDNLWARRGDASPLLVFAGHTDVVPPGKLDDWVSPPFEPTIRDDFLYGRGAVDMKGGIAAMLVACARFVEKHPDHQGSIAFLITSDEEGVAVDGTKKVIEHLSARGEKLDWCIVGEPSSQQQIGDMVKIGRRGSLGGKLVVYGKQGHVAYPHLAENPIHRSLSALKALCESHWDNGNDQFSPTAFQISNIQSGTGATNVIPGHLEAIFNFRYSPEVTVEELKQRVVEILDNAQVKYEITWAHSGEPFYMRSPQLGEVVSEAILEVTGRTPELSTSGGTSDGRFIATTGCNVVELGLSNQTIHQINEHVRVSDLHLLAEIYTLVLLKLLPSKKIL